MDTLSRINRSRAAATLVLAAVFLLLLFLNHETDLVADDYRYCFSYADDSRIVSVSQIIPSMAAHRLTMNGRVIAHALVQLFLLPPKPIFDAVNAAVFAALLLLIRRLCDPSGPDVLLLLASFGCLWVMQPDFGQVFLWLDGSVNYLWCAVLCLLWLLPWARRLTEDRSPAKAVRVLYGPFSFAVGAYSENATVALVAMALCFLLLEVFEKKRRPELWALLSLAAMLLGFFYMMLAPAESVNKSAEMRLDVLFANFLETARFYLRFWPLLLCFALFYALAVKNGVPRDKRLLSPVLLFGSLAGHFVLTFAMYTAARSTYIGLILLICADGVLFAALLETERRAVPAALCAVCLAFTLYRVPVGVRDIVRTHALLQYNVELIRECAANGETVIQVPRPYPETSYPAYAGLPYLNVEDPGDWPNVYMAKYYGVEKIIGY